MILACNEIINFSLIQTTKYWRHFMSQAVLDLIKDNDVKFVDLRFTDSKGKEQHVSIPHHQAKRS